MIENESLEGFFKFLGIVKKAGKLVTGDAKVTNAIKKGNDVLTIIADDASLNTKKRFINMLKYRNRQFVVLGDKSNLSHSIGESNKAIIVILDEGLSKKIYTILQKLGFEVRS